MTLSKKEKEREKRRVDLIYDLHRAKIALSRYPDFRDIVKPVDDVFEKLVFQIITEAARK